MPARRSGNRKSQTVDRDLCRWKTASQRTRIGVTTCKSRSGSRISEGGGSSDSLEDGSPPVGSRAKPQEVWEQVSQKLVIFCKLYYIDVVCVEESKTVFVNLALQWTVSYSDWRRGERGFALIQRPPPVDPSLFVQRTGSSDLQKTKATRLKRYRENKLRLSDFTDQLGLIVSGVTIRRRLYCRTAVHQNTAIHRVTVS